MSLIKVIEKAKDINNIKYDTYFIEYRGKFYECSKFTHHHSNDIYTINDPKFYMYGDIRSFTVYYVFASFKVIMIYKFVDADIINSDITHATIKYKSMSIEYINNPMQVHKRLSTIKTIL